jgi:hypothetical protein
MLTILGGARTQMIEACILDISPSGMRLRSPVHIQCGTPVKIDGFNATVLGEVCRSVPEDGADTLGLHITCRLSSLAELELLNRALIGERKDAHTETVPEPQRPR